MEIGNVSKRPKKKKGRCGMIAKETTLHKTPNDTEASNNYTIGNCTAFYNEQSLYRIVSYKRPRNDKCKTIQTRNLTT